jgi:citrate lyase subunit beta/citryl-CoA lyase
MDKLTSHLALAQTFLFLPGHRPEFFNKALASASKAIIIDLEDAVPPEQKKQARAHIQEFWQNCSADNRKRVLIRINPIDTDFTNEDLTFLNVLEGPINVVVPKVESLEQLNQFAGQVPSLNFIIPIIESARGIDSVKAIASHPLVLRLALGNIDTQADLGLRCDEEETELLPVKYAINLASRLAGIAPPIDGVSTDIHNSELLTKDTHRAKRLGFGAKLCIHPKQVDVVTSCFTPTEKEIDYAKRVVEADSNSQGAAVQLDGKMIDRPVVLLAKRTLQLANLT